jgi:CheY-like chemotaxis protein
MTSSHNSAQEAADQVTRSIRVGKRSARLIALSEAAQVQLSALKNPAVPEAEAEADSLQATDTDLSQQMDRCHVLVVNSDPAFLDAVRVLLQSNRYNVTSTNLVPQTFAMVQAAGADALVVDLATDEPAQWELVGQLSADEQTRSLPVVFTANDAEMLDAAETRTWPAGGRFHLLKPFDPTLLGDVIHALIGPA